MRQIHDIKRHVLLALVTMAAIPCFALLASTNMHPIYAYCATVFAYCVFVDRWTKQYTYYAIPLAGIGCGFILFLFIIIVIDPNIVRMLGPISILINFWSLPPILAALLVCLCIRLIKHVVYKYW